MFNGLLKAKDPMAWGIYILMPSGILVYVPAGVDKARECQREELSERKP